MADNPSFDEPTGNADDRLANLQKLSDGEHVKQEQMKWVDGANYGMLGADVGWAAYAGGTAAAAEGAAGAAALGAGALAAAPAVIAVAGAWGLDKIGFTGWMTDKFVSAGDAMGLTIGRGAPHPACKGDAVAHSSGFWGIVAGLAVGVAIGALVAATVATGGLLGVVLAGAALAGGLSLGSALASASQSMGSDCGRIMTGSSTVYFEGKKVARVTDIVQCDQHSGPQPLVEGSKTVFVNGLPLVRIGHETHCSGKINSGRNSIFIDKTTGQYGPKNPELSALQEFIAGLLGGIAGGAIARVSAKRLGIDDARRPLCKDPIDPVSGELLEIRTDISIPGVLPLELTRRYRTCSDERGMLGHRWSDSWSQRLLMSDDRFVYFHDGAGLAIGFDAPEMALNAVNVTSPRYRLVGSRLEPRVLDRDSRVLRVFTPLVDGEVSRLERVEDLDGNTIAFSYDSAGRLSALMHSDGYSVDVIYHARDVSPNRIVLRDRDGPPRTLVEYGYRDGMLADVVSYQFGQFHYEYDTHGWMVRWCDSDQTDVRYLYDGDGRVTETGTAEGYHTGRFVYESQLTRVIDADGQRLFEYDDDGMVVAETDPNGACVRQEWMFGHLVAKIDALGRRTTFRYNDVGLLIGVEDHGGRALRFEYDDSQLLRSATQANGGKIQWEYDHLRRVIARVDVDGVRTSYRYGARGELLRIVQGKRETKLGYDDHHRPCSVELPTGARLRREVDLLGRVVRESGPDGATTAFAYVDGHENPRGQLSALTRPDGSVVRVRYNTEGLPVEWIDPLGRTTRRTYGPFDLLTSSIDAEGHTTRFEYDHATRLTRVVNQLGEVYTYRYDAAGHLVSEIDWGGRETRYERDVVGKPTLKWLPDGGQWRYTYDLLDRIIEIDAGDVKLNYRYDANGLLASASVNGETSHVTNLAYDSGGRLIAEDQHGELLRHVYDADGRRLMRLTPRRETAYAYDPLGACTKVGGFDIHRDALGRMIGGQAGDFLAQQEYDSVGRLHRQAAGPRAAFEALQTDSVRAIEQLTRHVYGYDLAGQLERVQSDLDTLELRHDPRGQVVSAKSLLYPAEHFSYDAAMNITAHGHQGPVDTHRYQPGGLPAQIGYTSYRYDERGRTIEKSVAQPGFRVKTWSYSWDGLNRLVKVVTPERGVWTYSYDAFNRRVEKRRVGDRQATKFLWDGETLAERWVELRDGTTGQCVTWHIDPESFLPLAQETDAGLYPVMTDQIGLPTAVFDSTGKAVWKASYSVWGRQLPARPAANEPATIGPVIDATHRFPGQWADDETGLNYNLNRYYDPDSGQYLSGDPIGLEGGYRTQSYVHNPVEFMDPLGLQDCWGTYFEKISGTKAPEGMIRPHAHHIIFKGDFSTRPKILRELERSRAIAKKWDIDPVYDKDALMWATNTGHSAVNAKAVADAWTKSDARISAMDLPYAEGQAAMKAELQRIGREVFLGNND
ncbi:RHS repeat-associated core domain-containing protein [Burkholderia pyrrocinia]|uniref:RHS repeat-associated core domain-containing protein n=1 Tax=Burkholderia pyrrocinia TaxID=60550 RepID=UPI0030CEC05B